MPSTNKTTGELQLTQYIDTDIIDFIQDYNADMDKLADYANAEKAREGAATGFAMLDSTGKLAQMPTAADVGARSSEWLPASSDIGAQPQTAARSSFVKADDSGNLVAGTVCIKDTLYGCGSTPRTASGSITLSKPMTGYDQILIETCTASNVYQNYFINTYLPSSFSTSTIQMIAGLASDGNGLAVGKIQFGRDEAGEGKPTKIYLPSTLGSGFGIRAVWGVKFGA